MSIFRRGEIWYASYSLPGGKRIKESLGTADKRQAQELHDKRGIREILLLGHPEPR